MKKAAVSLVFLLTVCIVAAIGACFSGALCRMWENSARDSHHWIHSQLNLTPEQTSRLEAMEKIQQDKRRVYETAMAEANRELADAIRQDGRDSERVRAAISRVHASMGELQILTVRHVFEMKEVLTPDQYQKLLNLTADALNHLDSRHGGE